MADVNNTEKDAAPAKRLTGADRMGLQSKLLQRTVVSRIRETDWSTHSDAPLVVELDPTTACNLACPDCISRDLLNQGFFTRDRLRELSREFVECGVKAVVLIGGGEPLAHPEIGWVMQHLKDNGVSVGLTTNGILLNRYMDTVAQHVDWVRVSVDAATSETFGSIRPNRAGDSMFDVVIDNMRTLAGLKRGKLGYSFMLYNEGKFDALGGAENSAKTLQQSETPFTNVHEIYAAAKLARDIGCDYFEIKPMYNIRHFAVHQRKDLIREVVEQLEQAASLGSDSFRVLQAVKLVNTLSGEAESVERKAYHRCAVAQLRTLVTPSGVYVCPYFRGREDMCIGDARRTSFKDLWHGSQRREVMARLDPAVHCGMHCIRHDSNLLLEQMISDGVDTVVDDFDMFI